MRKIIDFLQKNGMEFSRVRYGNADYFGDGFGVDGLRVTFDFYLDPDAGRKLAQLEGFMKRLRSYRADFDLYGAGYTCRILTVFDAARLERHEAAIDAAVEAFWQAEHARRLREEVRKWTFTAGA